MSNQRFSITPAAAAVDLNITDSVFRTLAVIGIYGDRNGWCWPSQKTLAGQRGVSRQTINTHIKILIDSGYLNIQPRYDEETGAQKSNMMQVKLDRDYEDLTPPVKSNTLHPPSSPEFYTPHQVQDFTHNDPMNTPLNNGLSLHFESVSGCMANPGSYADDWKPVLDDWQKRYGDKAEDMITRAVSFARGDNPQGRRYTITSPRSIANIMANLETVNTNGKVSIGAR